MNIVSVSDLHLGSPGSRHRQFRNFLRKLPPGTVLVLNGDVIDAERRRIPKEHEEVLAAICAESFRRRIVWTGGNHDMKYTAREPNRIEFVTSWSEGGMYFSHGDEFMPMLPMYRVFSRVMKIYRSLRAPDYLNTIRLAKRMPFFFRFLAKGSTAKAVRFARKKGYKTVVCGHLHAVIDETVHGVRYMNAGAWTEWPAFYLSSENGKTRLVKAEEE